MPNWFYFQVEVDGTVEDVEQFVENVKGSKKYDTEGMEFDFNHFIPQPDNLFRENLSTDKEKELTAQGIPNWYRWNNDNWGTKWNANCDDVVDDINGGMYTYYISTAWADPRPVLHRMIEMYPNLNFMITGEEESSAYGIYIDSLNEIYNEEEPTQVDEDNGREVYYEHDTDTWVYMDNDSAVEDQDDFWPINKYSWS